MVAFDRLQIKPDVGFTATVYTYYMTFDFANIFLQKSWHNILGFHIGQCTGDNRFNLIRAGGEFTNLFEYLLSHFFDLDLSGLLDACDLNKSP